MNQERRPAMMRAQHRMREANRALDMAIYADTVSDADFQTRLNEFRSAQSELARLRFESELAVRKLLTPDQLVRFRELRRKFAEARESNMRNRRMRRGGGGPPPSNDGPRDKPPLNE
jgi:Spy/CpxP family protein refolding chaperone